MILRTMESDPDFKINNCAFRSDEEESRSVQTCRCAHPKEVKGYHCAVHNIFPLQSAFCQACKEFKQKELNG